MIFLIGSGKHSNVVEMSLKRLNYKYVNISKKHNSTSGKFLDNLIKHKKKKIYLHLALGDIELRCNLFNYFKKKKYSFFSIIDPTSIVFDKTKFAEGVYIGPGVIINNNVKIKENCIINSGCIIEHDVEIGRHVNISPGAKIMGSVNIGSKTFIGAGAIVNNNLSVCSQSIVGSGSIVVKNIISRGVYLGSPAKKK